MPECRYAFAPSPFSWLSAYLFVSHVLVLSCVFETTYMSFELTTRPTMEASTSQLQATSSPDTAARMAIRQRPQIHVAPHGPPSQPTWVQFWHPANNLAFLRLPTLDCCPPTFGIHYGTAITACQILACNEKGYLSTSRDGHAHGRINADLDSIISPGKYYYHLSSPKSEALYPICCDFSCWKFPHEKLPSAWKQELPEGMTVAWPTNWTAISERIKSRDIQSRVGIDGLPYHFPCCCQG